MLRVVTSHDVRCGSVHSVRNSELWYRDNGVSIDAAAIRDSVRQFLSDEQWADTFIPRCNSWIDGYDASFSRKLGERGWLGLTWPKRYGGGERSSLERYVVIEELLAAGAPVAAHWIAERQVGPSLLRFGTEQQREIFLPSIARGECFVAIGMSEPDSGSDLASVRTTARHGDNGWRVTGRKIWTSHAHRSHYLLALCRSDERGADRHAGLSQFLIDLASPGIDVRPITLMSGEAHFAEVTLDDVFVPESMLLGHEGEGWQQVNAELAFERSGPERFLSTYPLLVALAEQLDQHRDGSGDVEFGSMIANLWTLRAMSMSVAGQLDAGAAPQFEAAIVKDLGTQFENGVIDTATRLEPRPLNRVPHDDYGALLAQATLAAPGFTLRGGTTEILRGIIAKDLAT